MPAMTEDELSRIYRDLHMHPELSFQETRTAAIAAERLTAWGFDVTTGVGGTGVVAILDNGPGPTALLRADMDGLPVSEQTGLDYASAQRGTDREGNDVPVMHACGHDVHVACLLGAAAHLAGNRAQYSGRLMLVFQPAEELGAGAKAMVEDGLFDRFGRPDAFPAVVNDEHGVARTRAAFEQWLGSRQIVDPGVVTGSEDVGLLAAAAAAPCVFWLLGGADPAPFAAVTSQEKLLDVMHDIPSNHSPLFAPAISPTLSIGVAALLTATRTWLPVSAST